MLRKILRCAFVFALAAPVTTVAHHSHGNYLLAEFTHLTGTVIDVHWVNPHVWVNIEVAGDNGESDIWALEAAGATTLTRNGLSRETIQPGDTVNVRCHRLRDGTNGCLLGYLAPEGDDEVLWD